MIEFPSWAGLAPDWFGDYDDEDFDDDALLGDFDEDDLLGDFDEDDIPYELDDDEIAFE